MVRGQGASNGPDLSGIAREFTVGELEQILANPTSRKGKRNNAACPGWAFCPDDPWGVVNVKLTKGGALRGFARARGSQKVSQ